MSPRACALIHVAVAIVTTLTLRSAGAEEATSATEFAPLLGHRRVLVETTDGRLLRAKPVGVVADSLLLDRPRARMRVVRVGFARADVARAWVPKRNPRTMALVHGLTGFAGGALVELGMGSTREGLGFDAKSVFGGGLISGVSNLPLGALIGILWPGWKQAVPAPGADGAGEVAPFPAWSATATGGVVSPSRFGGEGRSTSASIAGWKNTGRHWSWGFEYGVLEHEGGHSAYPAYTFTDTLTGYTFHADAFDIRSSDNWTYTALEFRSRIGHATVRPLVSFGFGTYWESFPFSEISTDSLGNQTRRHGRDIQHHEGANLGLGMTWGRAPARPDIEARLHYIHPQYGSGITWITLQAGVTYN